MSYDYGTTPIQPIEEQPKKRPTALIIIIVVLVVLCCCCLIIGPGFYYLWNNGDQLFNLTRNSLQLMV
jgi:hypothetical protein